MVRKKLILTLISLVLLIGAPAATAIAQNLQTAMGVWADEDGDSNIQIGPCGARLCGQIVWLKRPNNANGQPKTDIHNPNSSLRGRPLIGLTIIAGLRPDSRRKSLKGRVYNANDGKVYDIYLKPRGAIMRVKGCVIGFLCDTQTWTRVR